MIDFKRFPCINVLPMDILNKVTDYEVLCSLLSKLNEIIETVNRIDSDTEKNKADIIALNAKIAEMEKLLNDIRDGKYADLYLEQLANWIDNNLISMVARIVKYVFFGLTRDGYFAAYIPDSWKFIRFFTPADYNQPDDYGHLWLYY